MPLCDECGTGDAFAVGRALESNSANECSGGVASRVRHDSSCALRMQCSFKGIVAAGDSKHRLQSRASVKRHTRIEPSLLWMAAPFDDDAMMTMATHRFRT